MTQKQLLATVMTLIAALTLVTSCTQTTPVPTVVELAEGGSEASEPAGEAALTFTGKVENELSLSMADLEGMDVVEITAEHPKKGQETYQGVRLNDLLDMAKPKAEAATLSMVADDGYSADVALSDAQACTDCLVAFQTEGGLRTVMPGMPSNVWVKGVIEIAIK